MKILVIGDIHGCYVELQDLLEEAVLTQRDGIIALIMMEFFNIPAREAAYKEAKEAVANQYHTPNDNAGHPNPVSDYSNGCHGNCDSVFEQVSWIGDIEALRDIHEDPGWVSEGYWISKMDEAREIQSRGYVRVPNLSWTWGNYDEYSPLYWALNVRKEERRKPDWWDTEHQGPAWQAAYPPHLFWVPSLDQDWACKRRPGGSCKGW